jgi:hypothetical protein
LVVCRHQVGTVADGTIAAEGNLGGIRPLNSGALNAPIPPQASFDGPLPFAVELGSTGTDRKSVV